MPGLFMYSLSSEQKLSHKMREFASETNHSKGVTEWAEKQHAKQIEDARKSLEMSKKSRGDATLNNNNTIGADPEKQLLALYKRSIEDSGVRIVPGSGEKLSLHHEVANFWQENPFKILAGIGGNQFFFLVHHCLCH